MSKFLLVIFCIKAGVSGALSSAGSLHYGMTMTSRAYDAVCWYETLKIFPQSNTNGFTQCTGQASQVQAQIDNPTPQNKAYMESSAQAAKSLFGLFISDLGTLSQLPSDEYETSCGKYAIDPDAIFEEDESDALNAKPSYDYPYKALAHCLIFTLRQRHNQTAIDAIKAEKTHSTKNWMQTLLDRENEFRARHGAPPLALSKDLVIAAQEWADTNAKECKMYHSSGAKFQGKATGESLAASTGKENRQNAAYVAADGWYEEIKDYPYPEYKGDGRDALFPAIGHFTQSVWKGTKLVGYGYAYNKNCDGFSQYIAARYYPAGNVKGQYGRNVAPPIF